MPPKDLTGQRFGKLTVIRLSDTPRICSDGKNMKVWVCRCDCGNEVEVPQSYLTSRSGKRSCGCLWEKFIDDKRIDLTGKQFGNLTALRLLDKCYISPSGKKSRQWLCRCSCGKEVIVLQSSLTSGNTRSCGCLISETSKKKMNELNVVGHYSGTTVTAIKPERKANKNSKSGVKGVSWSSSKKLWVASIGFRGKKYNLGGFMDIEDAKRARIAAEEKYFSPIIKEFEELKKRPKD